MKEILLNIFIIALPIYFATKVLFDLVLRGFAPFIPSRPWVVEQIMRELEFKKDDPKMIAFSSGRSGFFHAMEKKYPQAELIGIEPSLFLYLISWLQVKLRRSRIKVVRAPFHRIGIKDADFIYSHLEPDVMRGIGPKLKFECKTGCVIVSTGFNFSTLIAKTVVPLPDRKGHFDWLSKNQNIFSRQSRQFKKEKKAFIYVIE